MAMRGIKVSLCRHSHNNLRPIISTGIRPNQPAVSFDATQIVNNSSALNGAPDVTSDKYGWVYSNISMTLSLQSQSVGGVYLAKLDQQGNPIVGDVVNGESVFIRSFFNIYFDISISDIDTTANFYSDVDRDIISISNTEAWHVQFEGTCIADIFEPNLGSLVNGSLFTGFDKLSVQLGDINGNSEIDTLKLFFNSLLLGDSVSTKISGSTVADTFNSTVDVSGAIEDGISDPPFGPIGLTGPTVAQQEIVYPTETIPEPASIALIGVGLAGMDASRRKSAKS